MAIAAPQSVETRFAELDDACFQYVVVSYSGSSAHYGHYPPVLESGLLHISRRKVIDG